MTVTGLNIALLAINSKYIHSSLAVWDIAAGMRMHTNIRHKTTVLEAVINQPVSTIVEKVMEQSPDLLGISTYIWNARIAAEVITEVKKLRHDVIIITGGPEASNNARSWLELGADYVFRGEGETGFPAFVNAFHASRSIDMIPGLCRRSGDMFLETPPKCDSFSHPDPYTAEYLDSLHGRIAYIETSRGCPFHCAFCLSGGTGVRFLDMEESKRRVGILAQSGTKTIKFVDRTFNCNPARTAEILRFIQSLDTECCFHFEVAADLFDDEAFAILAAAKPGRFQLEIGLQTFFKPAIEAVCRKTDIDRVTSRITELIKLENVHIHVDLIAGLPRESFFEFQNSFDKAYGLGAHMLQLGFLKLLPGSALRDLADSYGIEYHAEPPYEIIKNGWITEAEMDIIRDVENALERIYNSGRFHGTANYALEASKLRPFEFFRMLGDGVERFGLHIDEYARIIFERISSLGGIDINSLRDEMICDWLSSMAGANMPDFLRGSHLPNRHVRTVAEGILGRKIARSHAAVLASRERKGVFVDIKNRNPITGLFKLHFLDMN